MSHLWLAKAVLLPHLGLTQLVIVGDLPALRGEHVARQVIERAPGMHDAHLA